jgi:hypothetical protein
MHSLGSTKDNYGADTGSSVVAYFLSNATTYRGENARNYKKELNAHLKEETDKPTDAKEEPIDERTRRRVPLVSPPKGFRVKSNQFYYRNGKKTAWLKDEETIQEDSHITDHVKRKYAQSHVDSIVDKLHVGTPDEEVTKKINKRTSKWNDPVQQKMALEDALKRHKENGSLYNDVMSGNIRKEEITPTKKKTLNEIQFGTLNPNGHLTNVRNIKQSDVGKCPHFIMDQSHYREDGSCKCNDAKDPHMKGWGYKWDKKKNQWMGEETQVNEARYRYFGGEIKHSVKTGTPYDTEDPKKGQVRKKKTLALPKGVQVVSLNDPKKLHNIIAKAVGEKTQKENKDGTN